MARRRRMADSEKLEGDNAALNPKSGGKEKDKGKKVDSNDSKAKGDDLQAIMARRRKLADGEKVEETKKIKEDKEEQKEPEKQKGDKLKEIMDRRRRIADGREEPAPEPVKSHDPQPKSHDLEQGRLHDIMERRRRLADGEETLPTAPISPDKGSSGVEKLMLAPSLAGRVNLAPTPRVTATPTRQDLKSFGVSSEMQKLLDRRRRMAEATNFVDEDEDSDEEEGTDRRPPQTVPSQPLTARKSAPTQTSSFSISSPSSKAKQPLSFSLKPQSRSSVPDPPVPPPSTFALKPGPKDEQSKSHQSFSVSTGTDQPPPFSPKATSKEPVLSPQQVQSPSFSPKASWTQQPNLNESLLSASLSPKPSTPRQPKESESEPHLMDEPTTPLESKSMERESSPQFKETDSVQSPLELELSPRPIQPPKVPELEPSSPSPRQVQSPDRKDGNNFTSPKQSSAFEDQTISPRTRGTPTTASPIFQTRKSPETKELQQEQVLIEIERPESPIEEEPFSTGFAGVGASAPAEQQSEGITGDSVSFIMEGLEEIIGKSAPPKVEEPDLEEIIVSVKQHSKQIKKSGSAASLQEKAVKSKKERTTATQIERAESDSQPVDEGKRRRVSASTSVDTDHEQEEDEDVEMKTDMEEEDEESENEEEDEEPTKMAFQEGKPRKPARKKEAAALKKAEKEQKRKKRIGGKKQTKLKVGDEKARSEDEKSRPDDETTDALTRSPPARQRSADAASGRPSLSSALSGRRSKGGDEKSVASGQSNSSGGDLSRASITVEDLSKARPWELRNEYSSGMVDGKISVFQRKGKIIAAQWNSETGSWADLGEVSGPSTPSTNDDTAAPPAPAASDRPRRKKVSGEAPAKGGGEAPPRPRRPKQRSKVFQDDARKKSSSRRLGDDVEDEDTVDEHEEEEGPTHVSPPSRKKSPKMVASANNDVNEHELGEIPPPLPPVSRKKSLSKTTTSTNDKPIAGGEIARTGSGFDSSAWGDIPAFGSTADGAADVFAAGGASSNFSGNFMADFGDSSFGKSAVASPVAFSSEFGTDPNFEDAFASAFDPAAANNLFAPTRQEPVFDVTPFTSMPSTIKGTMELEPKKILRCRFQGTVTSNPLNGNVIFSTEARDGSVLREVDTSRGNLQVMSTRILSPELRTKVANKYNASVRGLDEVIRVSAGLHESKGQIRVRVAAILHLRVLETQQPLRVVAVWLWGQGFPQPVSLQYIMSPPSGGDFSYDPSSLLVADSLLFLAGQSPKGPCVFISKPSVRESWTSNSLSGSGKVSSMEVLMTADRSRPYLAVALTDKSISVWTYKSAVEISAAKLKEQQAKRWLFPLCRLDCAKALSSAEASSLSVDGSPTGIDAKNSGHCTHLAWINSQQAGSSLLLIAACHQNGIAVFHVGLPVVSEKTGVKPVPEPTSGSSLPQSPRILPVVIQRWQGKHDRCMASWIDMGPFVNPSLSILLQPSDSKNVRLLFAIISIPLFRRGPTPKEKLLPLRILASTIVAESAPTSLLPSPGNGLIVCHSENLLYHMTPSIPEDPSGAPIFSLRHPVCSQPPGLSSVGEPLLEDTKTDKDGILHIFSTLQCERYKAGSDSNLLDWARPTRRYWICRTVVGDTKSSSVDETKEEKTTSQLGDGETVLGGSSSDVVCEIFDESLDEFTPIRLIRCPGPEELYAVLFRPSLCSKEAVKEGISMDAAVVVFIYRSESGVVVRAVNGRDAVFLPRLDGEQPRGLILQKDGLGLTYFTWDKNELKCILSKTYRPILGVEDDQDYVECKRILLSAGASNISLLAVGIRLRDLRTVVVSGELVEMPRLGPESWSSLLPNIVTGRSAWLEYFENVISFAGLEGDDSGYRNFSMVTSQRVLILSSGMEVASEYRTKYVSSGCLSPLGAFAVAFALDGKVRYLCCLDGDMAHGTIATLAPSNGANSFLLLAVRQDRVIGTDEQTGTRLVELGQKADSIFLPTALTKPALLLEPMVANAVSIGGKQSQSTTILRIIIEKFGRLVALAHGDNEGIGSLGAGLTSRVFQVLGHYGLNHAASWLLTGNVQIDRSANTTLLPPWLPVSSRIRGALNSDTLLHILSNGDQYLSDYVKNPDGGVIAALPRQTDPVSYLSRDLATEYLRDGKAIDALKMLDIAGSESTDSNIFLLSLMLEKGKSKDTSGILGLISGYGEGGVSQPSGEMRLSSAVAAVILSLRNAKTRGGDFAMNGAEIDRWIKPLAPSLQKGGRFRRVRQRLVGESLLSKAGEKKEEDDPLWTTACNQAKHIWNEGPSREKDKLLMLDRIEDWIGRKRPIILGKEGASAARDRGALADILNMDENSFGGKSDLEDAQDGGWVDGVGEGRTDEANLSGYFRFSEGENEDNPWRTDGFIDLSPYQIKGTLYSGPESFSLQTSTSSVDEGEPGKVKSLYDLVFLKQNAGALVLPAPRGGSLDVGVLHTPDRQARQRCTIEFWYFLPSDTVPSDEMVLIRRTLGASADDLSKVCKTSDKECMLWEVALQSSGEIIFRSCGGSTLRSTQNQEGEQKSDSLGIVQFGKWNHLSLSLSSRGLGLTDCNATILMMGNNVAESDVSMLPSGFDEDDLDSSANLKELLQKSTVLLGLNNPKDFRITELRIWACARSEDDINTFKSEYLSAAEGKKKFKVKIKSKKGATTLGKGNFLAKGGAVGGSSTNAQKGLLSLAPTPKMTLAPQKKDDAEATKAGAAEAGFATDFNAFGSSEMGAGSPYGSQDQDDEQLVTLWDTALPLSQQVRSSAAAALIRGPPATRHFGGNRGGLPDFSGMERFGVGGIAICGSEKTIVWRDNEDPPALTYPIGASGAIVSDQMDDEGSEFLCCFLARDKRMVVFELQSRTVVVELQMTTKLNFWRFLPPEAAENTLCFMLVTPVGGFHWMPLDESPRPQQVWKRGPDLASKKVVAYEEGGSNGLDGPDILSRVGLIMVTKATGTSALEAWIVPIAGDSVAVQVSDDVMGGCLCLPPYVDEGPFLPLLVAVLQIEEGIFINVMSLVETQRGSVGLGDIAVTLEVDLAGFEDVDFEPPALAMGTFPEAICCSLANIVVVLIRRKGLIVAFELEDGDMSLIAREGVDHYVIDAVMRYSAEVGGAEIVMLLADDENPKDGRMVSFCFRSAA